MADRLGINRTDMRCLDIIERLDSVAAGRLASEAGLSTGAVTTVIDRLERAGLARRVADPADRRRVLVELTRRRAAATAELYGPLGEAMSDPALGPGHRRCVWWCATSCGTAAALTETHAERVRGPPAHGQDGEAAS